MTTTRVLLLEAAGPESHAIAATAVARGYEVFAVTESDRWKGYGGELRQLLAGHLLTGLSSPDRAGDAIAAYAKRIGANAVLTTNEYLTPVSANVCAALGLPGNNPAHAGAARNKAEMFTRFLDDGVAAPRTIVIGSATDIERQLDAAAMSFPVVVKPAESAGSSGVTVVNGPSELPAAFAAAVAKRSMYDGDLDRRVIIQEYVTGTEYSVESMTQHGVTHHLCLTRKIVSTGTGRVEIGHTVPADAGSHTTAILDAARRAIASVGITDGPSHTEVMLAPSGHCVVIEVAARIGAGYIGHLIVEALGVDPWGACLDVALGRIPNLSPQKDRCATVRFLTTNRSGRLVSITGLPEPSSATPIVQVRVPNGSQVGPAIDNTGRLGCFTVVGDNAIDVEQLAAELLQRVTINLDEPASGRMGMPAREL